MIENADSKIILEETEVEGYASCTSASSQCLNDCIWPLPSHAFSSNN